MIYLSGGAFEASRHCFFFFFLLLFFYFTISTKMKKGQFCFQLQLSILQFLPHWSLHMKTLKLVVNGGGDLTWRDKMAASNQILKTYSAAFWLRLNELLLRSYCQCLHNIIVNMLGLKKPTLALCHILHDHSNHLVKPQLNNTFSALIQSCLCPTIMLSLALTHWMRKRRSH